MENKTYIITREGKPIFATSLFVEYQLKQKELKSKRVEFSVKHENLSESEHLLLLKSCTKNIKELFRKDGSLSMEDKS